MDLDIESFYEYEEVDEDPRFLLLSPEDDDDFMLTQKGPPSSSLSSATAAGRRLREDTEELEEVTNEVNPEDIQKLSLSSPPKKKITKDFEDEEELFGSPIPMDEGDDNNSWEEPMSSVELFSTQSQRIYSGLLSQPEFDIYDVSSTHDTKNDGVGPILRDVQLSHAFVPLSLQDFLVKGPKTRPARVNRMKRKKTPAGTTADAHEFYVNRQTKTYLRRLKEYKPILESKLTWNNVWRKYKRIRSIVSMSTLGVTRNHDVPRSQEVTKWGWDDDQGIGFQVYEEPIVLVGYILKQVPPELTRLHEHCKDIGVIPIPLERDEDSCLFLEDETGRIRIGLTKQREENVNFDEIVSGIPAAIVGTSSKGRFWVQDILFATPNDPEWPIVEPDDAVEMVFVSGLNFGVQEQNFAQFDLLMDYLQGLVGSSVEQSKIMKYKTRVFFVGNIFPKKPKWDPENGDKLARMYARNVSRLDDMLEDLARTMEVFILPGKFDLTHQETLPQPPFHRQLFPVSAQRPTFQRLSNPARVTLSLAKPPATDDDELLLQNSIFIEENPVDIILTSGSNVCETMEKCEMECPLNMSAKLLEWGHLHPTSIEDHDIAEELYCLKGSLPHLFVVGGLCEFGEKVWNGVRIIGVPSFADTGIAVTLTRNCDVVPINFKICNFPERPPV